MNNNLQIIRKDEALKLTALARTTFQNRINAMLLPPAISLGGRAIGFVKSELEITLQAMIAGKDEDEIKSLVKSLIVQRQIKIERDKNVFN